MKFDGGFTVENIAELLDAYERSRRWTEEHDEATAWEIARNAEHYSEGGTEVLRRCRPEEKAFVIDDRDGRRYVLAYDPPLEPRVFRRKRFVRWLSEAPMFCYSQWRVPRFESLTAFIFGDCTGEDPQPGLRSKLWVGEPIEFIQWLSRFPLFSYTERPVAIWRTVASVRSYYVEPNFYEDLEPSDIEDLKEHYPESAEQSPHDWEFGFAPSTGRVSFLLPEPALQYAEDLKESMEQIGVLCSPSVGIGGYTDLPDRKARQEDAERRDHGLPVPDEDAAARLGWKLCRLDYHMRRCRELEERLDDPQIPEQRKTYIESKLQEEYEFMREVLNDLGSTNRTEIYGLAIYLAEERDLISKEKDSAELDLLLKTERLRQVEAL